MFDLNEIPTIIKAKKHGKRYSVDLTTKRKIRIMRFSQKKSIKNIMDILKLPRNIINKTLKESE